MSSLSNNHDLIIGGISGFIDDIRINNIVDRYGNSYTPPTLSHDRGLGDDTTRRPILVNNLLYTPTEEIHLVDVEVTNTSFPERSAGGSISYIGRLSDGTTVDITSHKTITQISGNEFGTVDHAGNVNTFNVRYTTGVVTAKIHTRYKGIIEKEFTIIVNDTIQKDLNLIDALGVAGVGSVVCVDAGDANSGASDKALNLSGAPDFEYKSGVSLVGGIGNMSAYFANSSGTNGMEPMDGDTRSWSDGLHAGGSYSFCAVVNSSGFALCGTWNNSTSDRGIRVRVEPTEIRVQNYGRSVAPTAETNLTIFTETPNVSGWTFIAGSVTPGGDIFFRKNKEYVKVKGYRRGTTTTNLPVAVDILSGITSSSPSGVAPLGQFHIGSTPGSTSEGGNNIACFAFMLGGVSESQFDAIYDSVKERYGLPE